MDAEGLKQITFRNERKRAVAQGAIETASSTFLILIAVQFFDAGSNQKALIAVSGPLGLLLSPLAVSLVRMSGVTVSRGAALLQVISGLGFLLAAVGGSLPFFIAGSLLAFTALTAAVPLTTQMYQTNYPPAERGQLFSRTVVMRVLSSAIFSWVGGGVLDYDIGLFRWMMVVFAFAAFVAGWLLHHCPSQSLSAQRSGNPLHALRHVRDDRVFRWLLISWMLMGTGNLIMLPLRVEYLANPHYGMAFSPAQIALICGVVPSVLQLLMSQVWGRLFDRMNFFLLRIVLNVFFAAGILGYFFSTGLVGLVMASASFGIGLAGGTVAWSLWVTKIAEPEHVAEYMSVHTFLTGLRGLAAPFLGFYLIGFVEPSRIAVGSVTLIVLGSLLLVPEARTFHRRRAAQPLLPRSGE